MTQKITYEWACQNATGRPIVHGNGFIQVPMPDGCRVHVWHPDCPKQNVYTGVHDHRFSFKSTIVRGRLLNRRWTACTGQVYKVMRTGVAEDDENPLSLYDTDGRCSLRDGRDEAHSEGDEYRFEMYHLHEIIPVTPIVVTYMRKIMVGTPGPAVLCLIGQEPDNAFRRDARPAHALWRLIAEAML